jgi:hypothetical protein
MGSRKSEDTSRSGKMYPTDKINSSLWNSQEEETFHKRTKKGVNDNPGLRRGFA